jgi:gluconolactonase
MNRLALVVIGSAVLAGIGDPMPAARAASAMAVDSASEMAPAEATIDLATRAGAGLVKGQWRYSDTRIIEVDFPGPGHDGQPTGAPGRTYDYTPKAGAADFDDSQWDVIDPTTLTQRRATGRICFNWYRIAITIPERIGDYDTTGADVEFETALDDYAEIWVDGELPRAPGQEGGSVIAGWNATNRLVIGRGVRPGQRIQLAVFGINGPISNPPTNFIWVRHARLNFRRGAEPQPTAVTPQEVNVEVLRKDVDAMQAIVGANPKIFKLAEGFAFTEGPVWVPALDSLLFSDPNRNTIYRYTPRDVNRGTNVDSIADGSGMAPTPVTVLADRYEGKRLNSPNDLVYRSDGALFFTDPPFGLPKVFADPRKELSVSGVYMLKDGNLRAIATDLTGPNGIALSPDERYLYVGNWDDARKVVMRYEATSDGGYGNGSVLFDMTAAPGEDAIDGIKVDVKGHLYVSGPGGLWVLSPDGRHLGTIMAPRHIHNMAWGDEDRKTLYLCARDRLYRMRLNIAGTGLSAPAISAAPSSARR